MVAKTLLVVGIFAVANITSFAVPAPFFWYGDYDDSSSSSSEEETTKKVFIYLNVTGHLDQSQPGMDGSGNVPPLTIPIKLHVTVGDGAETPPQQTPSQPAAPQPAAPQPAPAQPAPAQPAPAQPAPAPPPPATGDQGSPSS